jgi:hypothetical protein
MFLARNTESNLTIPNLGIKPLVPPDIRNLDMPLNPATVMCSLFGILFMIFQSVRRLFRYFKFTKKKDIEKYYDPNITLKETDKAKIDAEQGLGYIACPFVIIMSVVFFSIFGSFVPSTK